MSSKDFFNRKYFCIQPKIFLLEAYPFLSFCDILNKLIKKEKQGGTMFRFDTRNLLFLLLIFAVLSFFRGGFNLMETLLMLPGLILALTFHKLPYATRMFRHFQANSSITMRVLEFPSQL